MDIDETSSSKASVSVDDFLNSGIRMNSTDIDKKLFVKIKDIVYKYSRRNSHEYIPLKLEYRASSIAYCSRKLLIDKDRSKHLDINEIDQLPQWFINEINEPNKVKFGASTAGQVIHEAIQEALDGHVIGMEDEVKMEFGDAQIIGHYDILIEDEKRQKVVIDIKSTMKPRSQLPNQSHTTQLMAYQGMLGGIKGALLYVNRNNWEMSYVSQDFEKEKFSEIAAKVAHLAYHEKREILPPIDESIFDKECDVGFFKCVYYNFCYRDDDKETEENTVPNETNIPNNNE